LDVKSRQTLLDEIERDALDEDASVAAALRKCLALGGHVHSTALREWALRELQGYEPGSDAIPAYRVVPAALMADWRSPGWQAKNDIWSPQKLPAFARDDVKEEMTLYHGVGEIEAMLRRGLDNDGTLDFGFQGATDLAAYMSGTGDPYQAVDRLYHQVSVVTITGLLDHVRTTLTSLVAELRDSPMDQRGLPTEAATDSGHVILPVGGRMIPG
jgi:hypothetical protein